MARYSKKSEAKGFFETNVRGKKAIVKPAVSSYHRVLVSAKDLGAGEPFEVTGELFVSKSKFAELPDQIALKRQLTPFEKESKER